MSDKHQQTAAWGDSLSGQVDGACDRFEAAWKAGERPRLEAFLQGLPETAVDQALGELLEVELAYRRRLGQSPAAEEYRARFPHHEAVIAKAFSSAASQPRRLGDYELLEIIGSGGMGVVYKARHVRLDRVVALKVLPERLLSNDQLLARFRQEMQSIGRLKHPNIVEAYDAREEQGVHILVIELIDGLSVDKLLAAGPLAVADACELVRQAAEGLQHAHEHQLVHRDIKPSNLILNRAGVVQIVDFGLARVNDERLTSGLTQSHSALGTLDYMAPEQFDDSSHVDTRADIYSLGCTLFNLLAGNPPYPAPQYSTLAAKMRAHCMVPAPRVNEMRSEVPALLAAVVERMLAKQPADRFATPAEVAKALAPFTTGADLANLLDGASLTASVNADTQPTSGQKTSPGRYEPLAFLREATPTTAPPRSRKLPTAGAGGQGAPLLTGKDKKKLILGAVGAAVLGIVILATVIIKMQSKDGTLVVEVDQSDTVVQVLNADGKVEVSQPGGKGTITISIDPGKHRLKVEKDGFNFFAQDFEMESGGKREIKATLEPQGGIAATLNDLAFKKWMKEVSALSATRQVEAVVKKLQELNPGFDGKETHKIQAGTVTELAFASDNVTDISPIRALAGLQNLECGGSGQGKGLMADLSPLQGMKLTNLFCRDTQVSTLSQLTGMPLRNLDIGGSKVSDLSPLKGMPLRVFDCNNTPVSNLSPLEGMRLTELHCWSTQVSDLSPLKGMSLTYLDCGAAHVADLTALKGMPVTYLACFSTPVSDLSPLKGMSLTALFCYETQVSDLLPLKGMPLARLLCEHTQVSDMSPLEGMKLTVVSFTPGNIRVGLEFLRQMQSIQNIGAEWNHSGAPEQFWKRYDAGEFGNPLNTKGMSEPGPPLAKAPDNFSPATNPRRGPALNQPDSPPNPATTSSKSRPPAPVEPVAAEPVQDPIAQFQRRGGTFLVEGSCGSWSPDGTRMVFLKHVGSVPAGQKLPHEEPGELSMFDRATNKVTPLGIRAMDPLWAGGEGKWIAYSIYNIAESDRGEVSIVDPNGKNPHKIGDGGIVGWAADGKTLHVKNGRSKQVVAINVEDKTAQPEVLFRWREPWNDPAFNGVSPDEKLIVSAMGGKVKERVSGTVVGTVPVDGFYLVNWSPDSRLIAFCHRAFEEDGVWVTNVQTGRVWRLADDEFRDPIWSSDGSRITLEYSTKGKPVQLWSIPTKVLDTLAPVR